MTKVIVTMLVVGFIPGKDRTIEQTWRFEKEVSQEVCLQMTQLAQFGKYGGMLVQCKSLGSPVGSPGLFRLTAWRSTLGSVL